MESFSLCSSSSLLPSSPFSTAYKKQVMKRVSISGIVFSSRSSRDAHDHHRLVDENMIVLRKRIHEIKMVERNYEPPEDWMEWEKRYHTSYGSIICEIMGVLQSQLMNSRPSFALGMLILIILSVPTSTAMACFHLMEITKGILAGIHVV